MSIFLHLWDEVLILHLIWFLCSGRNMCQPFWISGGWRVRWSVRRSSTSSKTSRVVMAAAAVQDWLGCPGTTPSSPRCQSPLRFTAWMWAWAASPSPPRPASAHCDHAGAKPEHPPRRTRTMFSESKLLSGSYGPNFHHRLTLSIRLQLHRKPLKTCLFLCFWRKWIRQKRWEDGLNFELFWVFAASLWLWWCELLRGRNKTRGKDRNTAGREVLLVMMMWWRELKKTWTENQLCPLCCVDDGRWMISVTFWSQRHQHDTVTPLHHRFSELKPDILINHKVLLDMKVHFSLKKKTKLRRGVERFILIQTLLILYLSPVKLFELWGWKPVLWIAVPDGSGAGGQKQPELNTASRLFTFSTI